MYLLTEQGAFEKKRPKSDRSGISQAFESTNRLTDPVPREMPDALGGRVTALLPSCPNVPSPQEPQASAAPWQEQGTGQEHMPYLTASWLSPTCLPILADSA